MTITPYHYAAAKKIQPLDPSSGSGRISIGKPFFLFANTQYECYVADGKLLWIARQGERIFCPDFPFSQDLAPAVVAALGAKEGTFRTNGSQPFALYFQLSHRRVPPQIHFSLAMD